MRGAPAPEGQPTAAAAECAAPAAPWASCRPKFLAAVACPLHCPLQEAPGGRKKGRKRSAPGAAPVTEVGGRHAVGSTEIGNRGSWRPGRTQAQLSSLASTAVAGSAAKLHGCCAVQKQHARLWPPPALLTRLPCPWDCCPAGPRGGAAGAAASGGRGGPRALHQGSWPPWRCPSLPPNSGHRQAPRRSGQGGWGAEERSGGGAGGCRQHAAGPLLGLPPQRQLLLV